MTNQNERFDLVNHEPDAFLGLRRPRRPKEDTTGAGRRPDIGGLLILGPKSTGKSSLVRAFAELLPDIEVVIGCAFGCAPGQLNELCAECSIRFKESGKLPSVTRKIG